VNPSATPNTRGGETGAGGRFVIGGFSRGNWKFTFSKEGYISYEIDIPVSAANRNPQLEVTLDLVPTEAGAIMAGAGAAQPELFAQATQLYDTGDYAAAITKWEEFLAANPTLHAINGNIGNAYRDLGDIEKATEAYETLLVAEPRNTMANYNLGEMLVQVGEIDAAMPYFEVVVEGAPDDPAVYYNVAELYFSQRELEGAITYYTRAIEVDPGYLPAYMQMGFAYVNSGDIPNAILAFEKYVEIAPEDDASLPIVKDVLAALRNG
jgi:tetratricopeptide (TPR) repeat protein